ncbi:hypothetical protein FKP32DRAFT_1231095 [Trametes sanguinea]|nr:hypothetical protein FKP32DRAFT_1231095 [Trametes sanguinea]
MDPDFIRKQVRTVWRVVSANAELMQGRNLIIEGAAVQSDFVLGQVSVLYDAVADSVNLKANHVREHQFHIMKPEFLSYQGMALKAVMDDNARLQDTSQTTYAGLSSLNESFINSLVTNLHDIVSDNMTVAMQHQIQPNALYMSRPSCIARLTLAFRSVMSTYVLNRRCLADQEQKRIAAERALEHMKVQVELTSADKSAAIAKVAECETSTSALLQQHEQSQAAANAAQARARQLEEELTSLKDKHSLCNSVERSRGYFSGCQPARSYQ